MLSAVDFCVSLLVLFTATERVQGQPRISQTKCDEYRRNLKQTSVAIPLTLDPNPLEFEAFNCSRTVDLIVGGEDALEKEFPHQALLGWTTTTTTTTTQNPTAAYDFRCGGTLVSERYVLTAAHCSLFEGRPPVVVRMAELDLSDEYNAVDFGIENITRYPDYLFQLSYHDIALVRLEEKVIISDYIRPACLWSSVVQNFTSVIATGFGHTQFAASQMSDTLRKVQLDALDQNSCTEWYETDRKFRHGLMEHQLCFGSKAGGGKDTCQGDSGGPIQVIPNTTDCTFYVVAVTSIGAACGLGNSQAVYSSVASHIDWIERVVWGE